MRDVNLVMYYLNKQRVDVNYLDDYGRSALFVALPDYQMLYMLLEAKSNTDV
jgi:hypothetical protein